MVKSCLYSNIWKWINLFLIIIVFSSSLKAENYCGIGELSSLIKNNLDSKLLNYLILPCVRKKNERLPVIDFLVTDVLSEVDIAVLYYLAIKDSEKTQTKFEFLKKLKVIEAKGNSFASLIIGNMLFEGDQIERSFSEAYPFFRRAADGGSMFALGRIGLMEIKGLGVTKSGTKGMKNLREAADNGSESSAFNLALEYLQESKSKLALKYFKLSAAKGHVRAVYNISVMYMKGIGTQVDKKLGMKYLLKAADLGYSIAQRNAALYLLKDSSSTESISKGIAYLSKSIEQEDPKAIFAMAIYLLNQSKNPDLKKMEDSLELVEKAALLGNERAKKFKIILKKQIEEKKHQ